MADNSDTRTALGGDRGTHVKESIQLDVPVAVAYRFWRRLENLPQFMAHLDQVTTSPDGRSHWVARGPAGLAVEWDAEVINEIENELLAWRSLPDSEIATAGSVRFDSIHGGRGTEITVHLQYEPPAGKVGAFVAALFGREPSQTIRADLLQLKQLLESAVTPQTR